MNLYFVRVAEGGGFSMSDYVVLASSKVAAEQYANRITKRKVLECRPVPNGHYLVGETFLNSES